MWPFKRRYPDNNSLDLAEGWVISHGRHGDDPLIVRINKGASSAVGHPEYTHQVGVAVPIIAPDANGFPDSEESRQLNAIEDLLAARLGADCQCIYVAAISTGGMREFVFYSSDPAATHTLLQQIAQLVKTHQIQHIIQPDPKWAVYRQFA